MAKANLKLADGTTVTIEGTSEEVAVLLQRFSEAESAQQRPSRPRRAASSERKVKSAVARTKPNGPIDYIRELVSDDFFGTRQGLRDVRAALEARGHVYRVTSLSPALVRLVRKKELRRIKEDNQWKYVNP